MRPLVPGIHAVEHRVALVDGEHRAFHALRDGRTVLSVLAPGDAARERARRALAGAGAHFMNFFGRFATVDVAPWRGAELPLPPWLRR